MINIFNTVKHKLILLEFIGIQEDNEDKVSF